MAKKMAVIAVEFDDPDDNFADASDFAFYVECSLNKLNDLDVTVYSTPDDLAQDTAEGYGIFAENRENAATPIQCDAAAAYTQSVKPR